MQPRRSTDPPTPTETGRQTLASLSAAAGALAAFQCVFLLWRFPALPTASSFSLGLLALGCGAALITVLILTPLHLLLRRLHPAWRQGHRGTADWSVAASMVIALGAWMIFDRLSRTPWIDPAIAPWLSIGLALLVALISIPWQPPSRGLRWTAIALAPLALCVVLLAWWNGRGADDATSQRPWDGTPRPDIVLITVDTLRADRLAAYGGSTTDPLMPQVDRAATEGVVFRRGVASSPWTMPSIASLMSSLSSLEHGAGRPSAPGPTFLRTPLAAQHEVLAERLSAAGYRTRAVVNNAFLGAERGFAQGFDVYRTPLLDGSRAAFVKEVPLGRLILRFLPPDAFGDPRAAAVTDQALEWLADDHGPPLFLWLHYIDPHAPYLADPEELLIASVLDEMEAAPRPAGDGTVVGDRFLAAHWIRGGLVWIGHEDRRRLVDYYDRAVRYTDQHLGRLFDALRQRQKTRPALIAFTADHGEEFWDHGRFEHGHDYYTEVTRVPLFFWSPGYLPAGVEVDEPAGLVDVAPTLLDLARLPVPKANSWDDGLSLVPGWGSETFKLPPRDSGGNLYNHPAVLIEDGAWRAILRGHGALELYHLPTDPKEQHNVAKLQPQVADVYRQILQPRLDAFMESADAATSELSTEDLESLRSLGYVQ